MAAADCSTCAAFGYRTCDTCSGLVFDKYRNALGLDLCGSCR
jgi:hypothetical protein